MSRLTFAFAIAFVAFQTSSPRAQMPADTPHFAGTWQLDSI